jgi:hypothetical protein
MGSGITLIPHVGRQVINKAGWSYSDSSVTLAKDIGDGMSLTAAYITTTVANNSNYASTLTSYRTGKNAFVLGLKYGF